MPIDSHIDLDAQRVTARVHGDFSFADIEQTIGGAAAEPGLRPGFTVLSDHTGVGATLTPDDARRMIAFLNDIREQLAGCRWAVVTAKPASWGMMRVLAARAEQVAVQISVFTTRAEAEAWLDR